MPRDDERDVRRPKTPPPIVRAQTAREERDVKARIAELQAELARLGGGVPQAIEDYNSAAIEDPIERIDIRSKRTSMQVESVRMQIDQLRSRGEQLAIELAGVKKWIEHIDEMMSKLLQAEIDDRKAREQRTEAARMELDRMRTAQEMDEKKAAIELRKSGAIYKTKVILAVIGMIGTAIASYLAGAGVLK